MITSSANAIWEGTITDGSGSMEMANYQGAFSVPSRFGDGEGTSPEELLAAAHAGCFSMQFSALLTRAGHAPNKIETKADVTIVKGDDGWGITTVHLASSADVPGIGAEEFAELAASAKATCPVSKLFAGAEITLEASLA